MNNTAEQSAPQESEVLNQGTRSENYMARFLTQTSDAFDSTKPFILGSPDPLKITQDKLQILDRYTLDYASNYWSGGEKKAMTHDQKLQEFGSKWANAITKRYALPKEGEAIYVAELNRRKDSGEVLKKLGLDPENMSVDAVRKFHDENFTEGRDVNAFIGKVKQSLSPEEMRAHLDDIEFVARMFDRETAKDIRALIELDLDANKDNYAKRANAQAHPRSDEEKRRLRELSKYLMGGEPHKEIDGNGSASTSSKDSKAIVSGNMNQGAGRTGQTEKTDSHEKKHAEVKYIPVIYDSYSDNENIARALNTGKHLFNNEEPKSKSADLHSPRVSTLTPRKSVLNESDIENKLVVALLNIKGISDPEEEVKELVSLHDNIRTTQDTMLGIGIEPKKALHASLYDLDSQIARYEENTKTNIREDLLVASLFDDKLVLAIKGDMSAVVDRNGSAYILGKDNIVDANYDGKKLPDGVVMSEHQLGEEDGDIIVAGKNFWDVFQDRDEVFKLIAKLRQESPNISEAEISKQLADVLSKRGVAGEFSFVILKRTDRLKIKIGDGDKDVLDVTKQVVKTTRNTPADIEITAADLNPEPVLEVDVPAAQPGQDDEIEIIKEDEEAKAKIMKLPELSDKQQEEFNKLTKEQKDLYISTRDVFNTQLEAIRVKYANNSYNSPINMTKHFKQTNQGNNGRWSCVPASIINATRAIGLPVEDNENQIVDKLGGYDAIGFLKLDKAHSYLSEYLRGTGYMSGGAISPMEIVKTLEDKGVWIANYGRHAILVSGFEVASDGGFWFRVNDPLSDEMVRVPVSGLYEKILDDLSKGRDIRGVILKKVPEQVAADPEIAKQVELV